MKLSVFGLAIFSLSSLTIYIIYLTSPRDLDNTVFGSEPFVGSVHIQKTSPAKPASHDWRVKEPKHLGRLQLSHYLERDMSQQSSRQKALSKNEPLKWKPIEQTPEIMPQWALTEPKLPLTTEHSPNGLIDNFPKAVRPRSYAQAITLPALGTFDDFQFTDSIEELAGASPIRPKSRDCGTLIQAPNATPKYNRVKSVGMSRQITDRTRIGVEYVYKDGCYNNQNVATRSLDMPSDDGVNLRVNMRF